MKKPSIPRDDEARLKALRSLDVLDTPPEERFDRLTRMAKRLFDVPIALISLVDEDRQWFKSCIGLSIKESPRDMSFCGHAILGNDIFVVSDATQDERFADNPQVINDPNIRFYAGCPLRFTDGSKLGTLCIIDRKPRNFSDEDLESLKDLASMVERELAAIQLATSDDLTSILNRRGFMMLGQHSIKLCVRQRIQASLAYIDLDKLKPINDTFGHAEGDRVLSTFANQVGNLCRESDIFARIGGDEFAILLMNTSKADADDIIVRIEKSLNQFNQKETSGLKVSFSYGIVEFSPDLHHSLEALITNGDQLMYENKKNKTQKP